jgi:hypothetical protein
VISTPATVLGYDHRIGFLKPGYDAGEDLGLDDHAVELDTLRTDVVLWDSHPLALGAAPKQVFIDGIAQLEDPHVSKKPAPFQRAPKTPDFSKEVKETLKYEGLPPLETKKADSDLVIFTNVNSVFLRKGSVIQEKFSVAQAGSSGVVVVERGNILCMGTSSGCPTTNYGNDDAQIIDLEGGSIS